MAADEPFITYKQAGVDREAGDALARLIRPLVEATHGPRVLPGRTGGTGLFRLDYGEKLFQREYRDPVLACACDGVGSKLRIALAMDRLEPVGYDLVAMATNDLVCCGAEPLFLMDYLSVGKIEPARMAEIVKGVSAGCSQAGCALLGGETAEMPGLPQTGLDAAGFAVGVVERGRIIGDGAGAQPGDLAIGLGSSGLHANGFGLARQALLEIAGHSLTDAPAELNGATIGEEMLRPTRLYAPSVLSVLRKYRVKRPVKAMAHVAAGGLLGHIEGLCPDGLTLRLSRDSWPVPPIFGLIARKGPVDSLEMNRVFNMGVGFVMIVAPTFASAVMARLRRMGERCWVLGKVRKGGPELQWA